MFARVPRLALAATLLGLAVSVAAFGGYSLSSTMNVQARTLILGVALVLSGLGQLGKPVAADPPATLMATLLFVWRSGAPFLAFAFALWRSSPVGAAAGALAGIIAAATLGIGLAGAVLPIHIIWVRRSAGILVTVVGIYALLWALRVVG